MNGDWLHWAAAAVLGGVVGASELISRYKDEPGAAIRSWPAIVYLAINAAASESIRYSEAKQDRFGAGQTRRNAALTLARAGSFPEARDWAQSALRDFEACENADQEAGIRRSGESTGP
ncbi:hypothetical protein SBA3_3200003 [Candidatus Sulfopaludibacter sp. SbA3]|nr:hypothetical protein SBA3_3200003 [Candidatus Sulfopaludibacter sp. SbA3]